MASSPAKGARSRVGGRARSSRLPFWPLGLQLLWEMIAKMGTFLNS